MMTMKQYSKHPRVFDRKAMLPGWKVIATLVLFLAVVCGCSPGSGQTATPTMSPTATNVVTTDGQTGELEPIVVPTMPAVIPPYLGIDPETGLTMTGTPTTVDFDSYRLKVSGKVDKELSLTYDDVRRMPKLTATAKLECVGYFVDTATWSGASLKAILETAGVQDGSTRVVFTGADGYSCSMFLENALDPENFLAYELEGKTLPVLQGFPLRVVIPSYDGSVWVKWLLEIEVQ